MGMTVTKVQDSHIPRVFVHKVADVRGGVSVVTSELGGDYLLEGTPLSVPERGLCHVIKTATAIEVAQSSATEVKVKKFQQFREEDFLMLAVGAKAVKVVKVDRTKADHDTLTLEKPLDVEIKAGDSLLQAKAESDSNTSELKHTPFCLVGTGARIVKGDNIATDGILMGVTRGANLTPAVLQYLKGIIDYN